MPNLYEISMLCESVYKKTLLIPHWQSIAHRVGQAELSSGETGYYGEAFLQADRKLIVVVHRGTKLYGTSEKYQINAYQSKSNSAVSAGNLINDAIVALKYVPPETQPALDFALHILERYSEHTIIHAGHSLGAFHANIVGYLTKKRVVGFDPVGCAEILSKLLNEMNLPLDEKQLNQHLNLLAEPNLINAVNLHLGNIYQRKANNDQAENNESLTSRISNTPATHKLKNFLDVITADRVHLGLEVPDAFTRVPNKFKITKPSVAISAPAIEVTDRVLNHGRLLKHSASTTSLGVNMRNSINATHIITQNNAVVSIVRRKEQDHAFLILEWMDANQQRVTKRAELGYKVTDDGINPPVTDKTKAQIYMKDVNHQWLIEKSQARDFYFQTFPLTIDEKDRLLQKIAADQNRDLDYVKFGNEDSLAGGAVGESLKAAGSSEARNASIAANHRSVPTTNFFTAGVHDSIDASLHRGNSCVSWAMQAIRHVKPDYRPTVLGELFITVPQWEVAQEGEHNTEGTQCRLI